jgi:hypothetical protein
VGKAAAKTVSSLYLGYQFMEAKMESKRILVKIVVIVGILFTVQVLGQNGSAEPNVADRNTTEEAEEKIVDLNVAMIAAADELRKSYIGQLDYFTYYDLYDLDGESVAYAIVYSKFGTKPKSLEELEKSMSVTRLRISALSSSIEQALKSTGKSDSEKDEEIAILQKEMNAAHSKLIGEDSFVTVITGAKETMPPILKHHKGLPTILTEKTDTLELLEVDLANEQNRRLWDMYRRRSSFTSIRQQHVLPGIVQQAGVIIRGKVLETQSQWVTDERGKHIYTFVTMHIDERLKGEVQEDQISFEVVGGTVGDITESVSDSPSFLKDEESVVFLQTDPRQIIREVHSKYQIYDGKVYINGHELTVDKFLQTLQILKEDPSAIVSLAEEEEPVVNPTDQGGGQLPPDQRPELKKDMP